MGGRRSGGVNSSGGIDSSGGINRWRRAVRGGMAVGALTVGTVVAAYGFSSAPAIAADSPPSGCQGQGRVFLVGGTWDSDADRLIGVEQRYTGVYPAAGVPVEEQYSTEAIRYKSTIWPLGRYGYDDSQSDGGSATMRSIAQYQNDCGTDKKVVVVGYSQGARVAGDVLTDIGLQRNNVVTLDDGTEVVVSSHNVSGELYSDPRQAGTSLGQGIERVLIGVIPGLTMTGDRADDTFGGIPVTTMCVEGDPICDLPDVLHDPLGALDDLLGYFVKHSTYPWQMFRQPGDTWGAFPGVTWTDGREVACDASVANVTSCQVAAPSSISIVVQQFIDRLGIKATVPDLMPLRFTFPDLFGIRLAALQPVVSWAMGWFRPLPELGYGGYLPDIFSFRDIAAGLLTWNGEQFGNGLTALGSSIHSLAVRPVTIATYWYERLNGLTPTVPGPVIRPSWQALLDAIGASTPSTAATLRSAADADESATATETTAPTENPQARTATPTQLATSAGATGSPATGSAATDATIPTQTPVESAPAEPAPAVPSSDVVAGQGSSSPTAQSTEPAAPAESSQASPPSTAEVVPSATETTAGEDPTTDNAETGGAETESADTTGSDTTGSDTKSADTKSADTDNAGSNTSGTNSAEKASAPS